MLIIDVSHHEGQIDILCPISDVGTSKQTAIELMECKEARPLQTAKRSNSLLGVDLDGPASLRTV